MQSASRTGGACDLLHRRAYSPPGRSFEAVAGAAQRYPALPARVLAAHQRQVFYLPLGDVQPDAVVDLGNGADRDGDLLAAPQMPLLEQDVGHLAAARIDGEPLYQADFAVGGMDMLPAADLCLAQRDGVVGDGLRAVPEAHADAHATGAGCHPPCEAVALDRIHRSVPPAVAAALHHLGLLGAIELVEFGDGAPKPDVARLGFHKVERHKPSGLSPVLRLDDEVGDGTGSGIHDHPAHLAAEPITAVCLRPDREFRRCCHGCLPARSCRLRYYGLRSVRLDAGHVAGSALVGALTDTERSSARRSGPPLRAGRARGRPLVCRTDCVVLLARPDDDDSRSKSRSAR